ncbi:homoserine dehydrogenase [bacterium]|nr:homoserine dehydrogenase [bacterium]MCK4326437.1 homoserine dehydrogenase [bacterium]
MKEKKLTIGLIGLGTVGYSVFDLLEERKNELKKQHGLNFYLKRIVEKDPKKKKNLKSFRGILCKNVEEILGDSEIDTVIELIGGIDPAHKIIREALKRKKNVVTGNKHLLGLHGKSLFREANKNNRYLGFRAAMTGCHQVLNHLEYGGTIKSILGVFNGTTNYILSQMEENDMSFSDALKQAQKLGYAERDPSLDIDGLDSAYKLILIVRLAFVYNLKPDSFYIEGIRNIEIQDVQFAKELGYAIKLLGIVKRENNALEVRVHPCLVPKNKSLALLKGVENGIEIIDEARGNGGLIAEGAGGNPAASAVLADLIDIANDSGIYLPEPIEKLSIKKMPLIKCKYYIRFNAINKPGVLAKIASVLAKYNINIRKVIQKGEEIGAVMPIIIITDEAVEREAQKAVKIIDKLPIVKSKTKLIRIEEKVF